MILGVVVAVTVVVLVVEAIAVPRPQAQGPVMTLTVSWPDWDAGTAGREYLVVRSGRNHVSFSPQAAAAIQRGQAELRLGLDAERSVELPALDGSGPWRLVLAK